MFQVRHNVKFPADMEPKQMLEGIVSEIELFFDISMESITEAKHYEYDLNNDYRIYSVPLWSTEDYLFQQCTIMAKNHLVALVDVPSCDDERSVYNIIPLDNLVMLETT